MVHDLRSHCPSWSGRHGQRCLCGGRNLWQLLAHILVHRRAEMGQEVGRDNKTQGSLPSNPLSLLRIHPPKGCTMSPHSATSWGPTVQTLELVGDISHPNHNKYLLASLSAPCFAIMSIHCRTVGIYCSSSA